MVSASRPGGLPPPPDDLSDRVRSRAPQVLNGGQCPETGQTFFRPATLQLFTSADALSKARNYESVDGGAYEIAILTPTINGVVMPALSIAFGTLTATTINTLRQRQLVGDLLRPVLLLPGDLLQVRRLLLHCLHLLGRALLRHLALPRSRLAS